MRNYFLLLFLLCVCCASYGQTAVVGDLNGDGKPDVVVVNANLNTLSVFTNSGGGNLSATLFPALSHIGRAVQLADFNGDGHLDLLVTETPDPAHGALVLEILLGDGHGGFGAPIPVSTGSVVVSTPAVAADFDGDGIPDIAFASGDLFILIGDGHGGFSAPHEHAIAIVGSGTLSDMNNLTVTDVNRDGKPDLIINGDINGSSVCYLALNTGNGQFISRAIRNLDNNNSSCRVVPDLNNDGNVDFLGDTFISFGDGQGGILYTEGRNSVAADGFVADLDNNTTPDFIKDFIHYYPGNGQNGYADQETFLTPPPGVFLEILAIADLNGDGRPDFVLQDSTNPANISFFINNVVTPPTFPAATTMSLAASAQTTSAGTPVTLIAGASSLNASPANGTGTVTFSEGATTLGTVPLGQLLDVTFTAGQHNVTASYSGATDASNFQFSASTSSALSVLVNSAPPPAAAPNVALTTLLTPAFVHNPVVLTATVTPSDAFATAPTGTVVFKSDGELLSFTNVDSTTSKAAVEVRFTTPGLHNVQAFYGGDANFPPATSATVVEDIHAFGAPRNPSTVQVALSSGTAVINQSVTLNATVVGVANPPSNFIYRVNGDFLAFNSPNPQTPTTFKPQAQGTYTISAEYQGDASLAPSTGQATLVVGNPTGDFSMSASPTVATIKAGQSASFTITIDPANGLASTVNFACTGLPAASTCAFSPASLTLNGAVTSTNLTITTTAAQGALVHAARLHPGTLAWPVASFGLVGLLWIAGGISAGTKAKRRWLLPAAFVLPLLLASCGGGGGNRPPQPPPGNPGTPAGTSTVTVTATSATSHTTPLTIVVTP
ncbi:MAG TPA: FG-GAP-like repeat-containing protein [Candidatus Angelobacter sp.]|nr:FG-GAP-like repeat-containing protein [Candidatus Angelobacter sp.]